MIEYRYSKGGVTMKRFNKVISLMIILVISLCMASCSASSNMNDADASMPSDGESSASVVNGDLNRKIIYTVNMTIESLDIAGVKNAILEKNCVIIKIVNHCQLPTTERSWACNCPVVMNYQDSFISNKRKVVSHRYA